MKSAFIGDIHGSIRELREVARRAINEADHVVFLGDYVNRGPDSRAVLDELVQIQTAFPQRTSFLRGNHDGVFLEVLSSDDGLDTFLKMGGAKTVRSYLEPPYFKTIPRLRSIVPRSHRLFLESLENLYIASDVVAAHDARDAPRDHRFVVAGHSSQTKRVPLITSESALIDTGCGTFPGGRLTCLAWPSLEWWQSSE